VIIAKVPMRVSFVGGGSDLPRYLEKKGFGTVITSTLNKYVYVVVKERVLENSRFVYSEVEEVDNIERIRHEYIRNALKLQTPRGNIELYSIADLPARGTGLGASSAFSLGLVAALSRFNKKVFENTELASLSSRIEIDMCNKSSGYQDQYASALGGLSKITFDSNGYQKHEELMIQSSDLRMLDVDRHFALVPVLGQRDSEAILREHNFEEKGSLVIQDRITQLVPSFENAMKKLDYKVMGEILHENWTLKMSLNDKISNPRVDEIYSRGMTQGAYGGKLLGAGQSGYILFSVYDKSEFYNRMQLENPEISITGQRLEVFEL
jgi:D-glycero-alpha-D-manno-heptose-7-phosphate kinase